MMKNIRILEDGNNLVHGVDFAEDEMTICGTWTCNEELQTSDTKAPVDCPQCIKGLEYYAKIKKAKQKANMKKTAYECNKCRHDEPCIFKGYSKPQICPYYNDYKTNWKKQNKTGE